ncbi:MAG: putative lipid II flippase FtsW [Fibrobacterota bacterium]
MKTVGGPPFRIDVPALVVMFLLIGIGMVMVYSSSVEVAKVRFNSPSLFLGKQAARLLLAFVFFYLALNIDYHWFAEHYKVFLGITAVLLLILLVSHNIMVIKGAKRWINLFGMTIQPSDLARLSLIIYMARMLSRNERILQDGGWEGLLTVLSVPFAVCLLILLQPNFSTVAILSMLVFTMAFAGGMRMRHVLTLALVAVPVAAFALLQTPYRLARVKAFLDPVNQAGAYQGLQSLIGLGSGGLWGVGLGESSQKLLYLPEPFTDFVFSILGEEFGFVGVSVVFLLFALLLYRGFIIANRAQDKLGYYLALGITVSLGLYLFIHAGVVSTLLPTTGIPLPFVSYGGSNLLFNMIAMGILLNISGQRKARS